MENITDCKTKDTILSVLINHHNEYCRVHRTDGTYKYRGVSYELLFALFEDAISKNYVCENGMFEQAFKELTEAEHIEYFPFPTTKIVISSSGEAFYNKGLGGYCKDAQRVSQTNIDQRQTFYGNVTGSNVAHSPAESTQTIQSSDKKTGVLNHIKKYIAVYVAALGAITATITIVEKGCNMAKKAHRNDASPSNTKTNDSSKQRK